MGKARLQQQQQQQQGNKEEALQWGWQWSRWGSKCCGIWGHNGEGATAATSKGPQVTESCCCPMTLYRTRSSLTCVTMLAHLHTARRPCPALTHHHGQLHQPCAHCRKTPAPPALHQSGLFVSAGLPRLGAHSSVATTTPPCCSPPTTTRHPAPSSVATTPPLLSPPLPRTHEYACTPSPDTLTSYPTTPTLLPPKRTKTTTTSSTIPLPPPSDYPTYCRDAPNTHPISSRVGFLLVLR
jgi:hypothetical protein